MKRALLVSAVAVLVGGCAASDQPGGAAVYDRIGGLSDCAALQQEFDTAYRDNSRAEPGSEQFDVTLSYMNAAQDRMEEVDCS